MKLKLYVRAFCFVCTLLIAVGAAAAQTDASFNLLSINDVHLDPNKTTPMALDPSSRSSDNDLDRSSLVSLTEKMSRYKDVLNMSKQASVLLLGDLVGHGIAQDQRTQDAITAESEVFYWLPSVFTSHTLKQMPQWYYQFGNNDSIDADYGAFLSQKKAGNPWTIAALSTPSIGGHWYHGIFFPREAAYCQADNPVAPCLMQSKLTEQGEAYGLSLVYIKPGLFLINFNDVPLSAKATPEAAANAQSVINWLNAALAYVVTKDGQAIVAMHIPFGDNVFDGSLFLNPIYAPGLLKILDQYHKDIVAVLAAHTHMNEFKVLQHQKKSELLELISPALSTSHDNAASFSIYHLQQQSGKWQLMNMNTYRFDDQDSEIKIKPVMDMRTAYRCLSGVSLTQCILGEAAAPSQLYAPFKAYYLNGNPNAAAPQLSDMSNLIVNIQ